MMDDDKKDGNWLVDGITDEESRVFYVFSMLFWAVVLAPLVVKAL